MRRQMLVSILVSCWKVRREAAGRRSGKREESWMVTMRRLVRRRKVRSRGGGVIPGIMVQLRLVLGGGNIRTAHGASQGRGQGSGQARRLVIWQGVAGHWKKVGGGGRWGWGVERRRGGSAVITVVPHQSNSVLAMDLEMFPQRGRMGVGLITTPDSACVRFVCGVDMHVLLPVAGVGKPSVTPLHLTFKWLLTCKQENSLVFRQKNILVWAIRKIF